MSPVPAQHARVLSGMRPTGRLHLGHYHGVLKNWIELQHEYQCFFFVADWHALTTHYEDPAIIPQSTWEMVVDWLAAGVNPGEATLFIQSRIPEHAELHLLLSMITPLGWLERVPSYKDQQERLKERDLSTYGFLGYPLLQSADILIYKAGMVPVGEDQVAHVELTREVARRFNHLYGREPDFEEKAEQAIKKMGKKNARLYEGYRRSFQEQGDDEALEAARALLEAQQNLTVGDRDRLFGYLEGGGKVILPEPQPLLTRASKMPGLDGQKMSKSYGNTIALRADLARVEKDLRTMPTDPARVRRNDPGDPAKCPVWQFHEVYSDERVKAVGAARAAARQGSAAWSASSPSIDAMLAELRPIQARAKEYEAQPEVGADHHRRGLRAGARGGPRDHRGSTGTAMSLPSPAERPPTMEPTVGRIAAAAPASSRRCRFAIVQGEALTELPKDLYIPPDALEVILEAFEGPLDLLLYLIRRQNLDILDIPIAEITAQYMAVHRADGRELQPGAGGRVPADGRDAGGDQVAHAAAAAERSEDEEEEDPRAQLVRRLQEYERYQAGRARISTSCRRSGATSCWPASMPPDLQSRDGRPDVDAARVTAGLARRDAARRHVRQPPCPARAAVDARAHDARAGAPVRGGRLRRVRAAVRRHARAGSASW